METKENLITQFILYLDDEITSAISELKKVDEKNRRHLQRLVYIDVINRFDSLVDSLLIAFSSADSGFRSNILSNLSEPIAQKELYEILFSEDPRKIAQEKVRKALFLNFLTLSHRKKVFDLLHKCYEWKDGDISRPRVNPNNGSIFETIAKHKTIPTTIVGYADWLYRRRNVLVHREGDGKSFRTEDIKNFRIHDNVDLSKKISIRLSSIESASAFYKSLCTKLKI